MNNKTQLTAIVFSVYILMSYYVFGGGMVNSMVAYKTWRAVGPAEFVAFHDIDSTWIIPVFVILFFLSFIPQILLFWFRPAVITKPYVWIALILNLIILISTIAIQIPIQKQLNQGFSLALIDKLISTDFLYRKIPGIFLAIVNFIMLYKVVKSLTHKHETVIS